MARWGAPAWLAHEKGGGVQPGILTPESRAAGGGGCLQGKGGGLAPSALLGQGSGHGLHRKPAGRPSTLRHCCPSPFPSPFAPGQAPRRTWGRGFSPRFRPPFSHRGSVSIKAAHHGSDSGADASHHPLSPHPPPAAAGRGASSGDTANDMRWSPHWRDIPGAAPIPGTACPKRPSGDHANNGWHHVLSARECIIWPTRPSEAQSRNQGTQRHQGAQRMDRYYSNIIPGPEDARPPRPHPPPPALGPNLPAAAAKGNPSWTLPNWGNPRIAKWAGCDTSPSPAGGDPFWQKNKRIYHFLPLWDARDTRYEGICDTGYEGIRAPHSRRRITPEVGGKRREGGEERRKERKGERCLARCSRTSPPLG